MFLVDDDDGGGAWATGDGALTCMPELNLEDELLNEQEDPARVSLSFSLCIILQKSIEQQKLVERVRK